MVGAGWWLMTAGRWSGSKLLGDNQLGWLPSLDEAEPNCLINAGYPPKFANWFPTDAFPQSIDLWLLILGPLWNPGDFPKIRPSWRLIHWTCDSFHNGRRTLESTEEIWVIPRWTPTIKHCSNHIDGILGGSPCKSTNTNLVNYDWLNLYIVPAKVNHC